MKLGLGEWGMHTLPIEEHLKIALKYGFEVMEFGIGEKWPGRISENITEDEINGFKWLCEKYGVRTPLACLENDFTLPDGSEGEHKAEIAKIMRHMELSKKLGAEQIRLFTGFTPFEDMTESIWDRMFDAFNQVNVVAMVLGLKISIETHASLKHLENGAIQHIHTITTHRKGIKRLLRELPPSINFNYDPGNVKASNPNDDRYLLDLIGERIDYCHLKDWVKKRDGWVAKALGDGDLDYPKLLNKMNYNGYYILEYEQPDDFEDGIQRNLDYLKSHGINIEF